MTSKKNANSDLTACCSERSQMITSQRLRLTPILTRVTGALVAAWRGIGRRRRASRAPRTAAVSHPPFRGQCNPGACRMADKLSPKISLSDLNTLEQLIIGRRPPADRSRQARSDRQAGASSTLRAKGYTWRDVAAWLTEHGLPMTAPSCSGHCGESSADDERREKARHGARRKAADAGSTLSPDSRTSHVIAPANAPVQVQKVAPPIGSSPLHPRSDLLIRSGVVRRSCLADPDSKR